MKNVVKKSTKPEYLYMGGKYYSFVVAVKGLNLRFRQILVDYTIIDLSNNTFEGEIPNVIGGLNSLIVLNLSHNSLNGPIPYALGNLIEIESLDLSWNQLSGEIPGSLAGIKRLAVLSLSHNRLVGRIPYGTQFNTFDENSFEGNGGLCGFPLPKRCSEYTQKPHLEARKDHEEESGFMWEVVALGYGCGTLLGLVMGYLMLSTRKIKWFNAIADATESLVLKKKRRHVYIGK
ncbi:leucine-rich repeat-containing protein [Tanacetum coccineum]